MATFEITSIAKRSDSSLSDMLNWLNDNIGQLVVKGNSPFVTTYESAERLSRHIKGIGWHIDMDILYKPEHEVKIYLNVYDDVLATQTKLMFI